jgi:hypothetical protein
LTRIQRKHLKWIVLAVILALLIPLAAVGGFFLLSIWAFQGSSFGSGIVQDCPGVSVMISGEVTDENRQPIGGITVQVQQTSVDSDNDLYLTLTTNDIGHFADPEARHIFFCDALVFDVMTDVFREGKYESMTIIYSLAENYSEFPARPIPIRIIFTLPERLQTGTMSSGE